MNRDEIVKGLQALTAGMTSEEVKAVFEGATGYAKLDEALSAGLTGEQILKAVAAFTAPVSEETDGKSDEPESCALRTTRLPTLQQIAAMERLAAVFSGLLEKPKPEMLILIHFCFARRLPLDLILSGHVYVIPQKNKKMVPYMGIVALRTEAYMIYGMELSRIMLLNERNAPLTENDTPFAAMAIIKHGSQTFEGYYSLEIAKRNGLLDKDAWRRNTAQMLMVRAEANALRSALGMRTDIHGDE